MKVQEPLLKQALEHLWAKCCLMRQLGPLTVRIAQICLEDLLLICLNPIPRNIRQPKNFSLTVIQTVQGFLDHL